MAADGRRSRWRRWVAEALSERLGYKAAALFLALVLWIVVSAEEPSEELVPVRLVTLHDSTRALVGERPTVRALVVGHRRYENPEYRRYLRRFELAQLLLGKRRALLRENERIRRARVVVAASATDLPNAHRVSS